MYEYLPWCGVKIDGGPAAERGARAVPRLARESLTREDVRDSTLHGDAPHRLVAVLRGDELLRRVGLPRRQGRLFARVDEA